MYYNSTSSNPTSPKDAATVILIRENSKKPFELFLMRRNKNQSFMGGAFVFPGGALDSADCDPSLSGYSSGLSPDKAALLLNETEITTDRAFGLFFTAIRETFEESGVLLADIDGNLKKPENKNGFFSKYRKMLHEGSATLKDFAEKENIRYNLNLLMPYARWITPEVEGKRFDTRFFIAKTPDDQKPSHDSIELVDSLWLTPAEALEKQRKKEILLMPPTLKTIEELSVYSDSEQLFSPTGVRKITPILPQTFQTENGFGVKLPCDPEYTIPVYKQPARKNETSRIVMIDGRWETRCVN